jgi:hypothetical protein
VAAPLRAAAAAATASAIRTSESKISKEEWVDIDVIDMRVRGAEN